MSERMGLTPEKPYVQPPIGEGKQLEAAKETLPAVEVKNRVLWVNENFPELPFKLHKGESTKLGMFLTPKPETTGKEYSLEVQREHGRSGLIGRIVFQDADGRLYRDVDAKGVGYVDPYKNERLSVGEIARKQEGEGHLGVMDYSAADHNRKIAEKFVEKGIRAVRTVAIIELEELIGADGQKVSLREAKKQRMIGRLTRPMVEVRAFGTQKRIRDVTAPVKMNKETELFVEDARKLVAQELGQDPEKFGLSEYAHWLAQTIGRNIGLMHKHGWRHNYFVAGHNITLDGRFVDFDSVVKVPLAKNLFVKRDVNDAKKALVSLFSILNFNTAERQNLISELEQTYEKAKGSE